MNTKSGLPKKYVSADGEVLNYTLVRSRRKSLALYIYKDGQVVIRSPQAITLPYIDQFLATRLDWLKAKRTQFESYQVPEKINITDSVELLYLGQWLPLRVSESKKAKVNLGEDFLEIFVPAPFLNDEEYVLAVFYKWLKQQALILFQARLDHYYPRFQHITSKVPNLRVRKMKSRWGSCSNKGAITLGLDLMHMPLECIDYVVVHELCHLKEFNHGPRFYTLQASIFADWSERKSRLNTIAKSPYFRRATP